MRPQKFPATAGPEAHMNATQWIWYDGNCPLCRAMKENLQEPLANAGFSFAPLQEEWVRARLGGADPDREMKVLQSNGTILGGADAMVYLANFLPWAWPVRLTARIPGGMFVLRHVYRHVAARRICGSHACTVPSRGRTGWTGWLPVLLLPPLALVATWRLEPWITMWAVAIALFAACKWLTWWEAFIQGKAGSGRRWLAYLILWVGMDAAAFLDERRRPREVPLTRWLSALAVTIFGAITVWGLARAVPATQPLWQGWIGMIGGIFLLHFGLFRLLAFAWQARGVDARPIMENPMLARSLGELWGRRWNRGFNDLVRRHSFSPLVPRLGVTAAMLATFLVSGLIHDLVIAVPARTGFGLPTAYFLLQGLGVIFEKLKLGRQLGLRHGVRGRLFVFVAALGPAGILFFPRFVETVAVPFLKFIHAL